MTADSGSRYSSGVSPEFGEECRPLDDEGSIIVRRRGNGMASNRSAYGARIGDCKTIAGVVTNQRLGVLQGTSAAALTK